MPFITITYPPKYPLTETEKRWLEERKQYIQQYNSETFCKYCYYIKEVSKGWACDADICPTDRRDHDYEDAAEFEALVAAIMPYIVFRVVSEQAEQKEITIDAWTCLKLARLAVEAEMEEK